MANGRTRGGRNRPLTNLQTRRRLWDNMKEEDKRATKCPGSNKK
jgi:hypothetical protein